MNSKLLLLGIVACSMLSCSEEKVRTYRVASDEKTDPSPETTETPSATADEELGDVQWTPLPAWKEQQPGQFQIAVYKINETASLSVSSFPGDAGGIPANVNRWRQQIGLPEAKEVGGEMMDVEIENVTAQSFDLKGEKQSILASIIKMPSKTWFFKLSTDTAQLETMRQEFTAFLSEIKIPTKPSESAPKQQPDPTPPAKTDKKGIGLNVPDGWVKSTGSSMRVASFSIPGKGVPDGDVSVVPLGGQSGTTLENVNRWRGQVKLAELKSENDPAIGTEMKGQAGTFLITHLISEESLFENNRKGAISTAILKRGDTTWFFKITGEADLVIANREKFEKFVLTAEIP